ncbi:ATP-dependent 6-phosphofructokinase [Botrimarina hoheduenensis]|uniref:Pyrophosphate--fructose 6-phosphate 1-phosphotransferase n=1 Tax=Botrimarina hoheduenensis TaxID=2528000 RepID=A0A5C5W9G7_9BACT|nr:ATP-dependent 6-phosphofructokinase [Botrimarina hoheduenensis]TWT47516.1 Pyrophosphate--fructose 6-phosphate 1-phosphotransferase [Botrimarina hoheduenensis]
MPTSQDDLRVATLGESRFASPLTRERFTPDNTRVLLDIDYAEGSLPSAVGFEKAGAREQIYFDPSQSAAAIVTCGGLCPGLNNVIRHLYYALHAGYGVPRVLGVRHGYQGLNQALGAPPLELTADLVEPIHHQGGTMLGTSRGPQDPEVMLDTLGEWGVNLLFPIGGDGTQRGAHALAQAARKRGQEIAVVGIPKTIDNDIRFCFQTFGFASAVGEAERVIDRAHVEAKSVERGVGLVKLMGREAGFIAAAATVASGEVNFALVPEHPVPFEGDKGFFARLGHRLDARGHAVVVVAEGVGQDLLASNAAKDASGNRKLGDIGLYLKERISEHFNQLGHPISMKYFDPSYYIRSVQANAGDSVLTERFARHAANAALAGKTDLFVGSWNGRIVHVPLAASIGVPRRLAEDSELWTAVEAVTGQSRW